MVLEKSQRSSMWNAHIAITLLLKCNHFTILNIQEMIMLIRTKASMNVSFTIDTVSEHLTINKYRSNAKACNVSLHSIYCSSSSSVVCLFWFPLKRKKRINLHSHVISMHLSNSLIIYEEKTGESLP